MFCEIPCLAISSLCKHHRVYSFIVVPCTLFQSLLYCSNSCTSLHFKTLKYHTKTLKIRPYMFRSPLKPPSDSPWHIVNDKHAYDTANETLKLLKPCNKGSKMNCWESFYIQIYCQCNRLITEQLTGDYNLLYEQAYFPHNLQHIP
jgi:hypothetical protein